MEAVRTINLSIIKKLIYSTQISAYEKSISYSCFNNSKPNSFSSKRQPCVAISVITDECDPANLKPVNIAEIIEVAGRADSKLSQLFVEVINEL